MLDRLGDYLRFVDALAREGLAAGRTPLELAQATRPRPFAELTDPERIVGNLHRAYADLSGDPPGTRLDLARIWPDMVTFHGGPIACHA